MNGFEAFWLLYPRKVAKFAAEKSYAKALLRATPEEILLGVERSKLTWSEPQFIPYPATWLNQGRWMDEEEPAPVKVAPRPTALGPQYFSRDFCPHVEQCATRFDCKNAKILGKPEREEMAS